MDLMKTYGTIKENETRAEAINTKDCEILIVAYGTTARIVKNTIKIGEKNGVKIGLIRPVTLWTFPSDVIAEYAAQPSTKIVVSVELSTGQMLDDVKIAVNGIKPVKFFGRTGGVVPLPEEIYENVVKMLGGAEQ